MAATSLLQFLNMLLICFFQIILAKLLDCQFCNQIPDRLSVVEDSVGFLVLFSDIKVVLDKLNNYFVKDKSQYQRQIPSPSGDALPVELTIVSDLQPLQLKNIHLP